MKVSELHSITPIDTRRNSVRLHELNNALIQFKKTGNTHHALIVMKNCITLVNDVLKYSKPIKLEDCYLNYGRSFLESSLDRQGRFNYFRDFDTDFSHYITKELYNDFAPRFYCKLWFSTVVGVLVLTGLTLTDITEKYRELISFNDSIYEQTNILEYL